MAAIAADRHLLFGLLALQNGLIDQGQLMLAFQAWTRDKSRGLADHLQARGDLTGPKRAALEALAAVHVEAHGGDVEKSLAAVPANHSTRASLASLGEPEIEATLARVTRNHNGHATEADDDPDRTSTLSVGAATSQGERFRLLRPHARGGLGEVFVALDAELHREVALKQILERHADDPVSRQRFVAEAEITGGLEHPGVVPVYGLGTYGGGRPYYAMRFIRGDSLKEAIDHFHGDDTLKSHPGRRSLALRKLLRRFLDVCNAVDYAHSRGVIHRDLKPANIILGKHGETLVVDWGLAKAIGRADPSVGEQAIALSSSGSSETLPGSALGTPAYMSPEQAGGDLERLGPRSDVYSLGATLYCLLTGRPPFEGEDVGEILRRVQAGDVRAPRQVDASLDKALDAVCAKAMATNPEDRHPSCRALADDVERWMADEPVSAWADPWTRKLLRWLTRHRTSVTGAAAAVLAGVVGLSAVLAVQTRANAQLSASLARETKAGTALAAANARLVDEQAKVLARFELAQKAIATFHTGVSEDMLLKNDQFRELRTKLLKEAAGFYAELEKLLVGQTDTKSRKTLAEGYFQLGELTDKIADKKEALAVHRKALALRRELAAVEGADVETRLDVARSLDKMGGLLRATGDNAGALARFDEQREIATALEAEHVTDGVRVVLAQSHHGVGDVLMETGKPEAGLASYRKALVIQQRLADAKPGVTEFQHGLAKIHNSMGALLWQTGKPEDSLTAFRKVLAIQQKLADAHPGVPSYQGGLAQSHNNIACVLCDEMGKREEALTEFREAVAIEQKLADANPAVTEFWYSLAIHQNNVGEVLSATRKPEEALTEYRKALAVRQKLADANPAVPSIQSSLARSHWGIGNVMSNTGKPEEAMASYLKASAIWQKLVNANPAVTRFQDLLAKVHRDIARLLELMGKPEEAMEACRKALAIDQKLSNANPTTPVFQRDLAIAHNDLGRLLARKRRFAEAFSAIDAGLVILSKLAEANPKNPEYANALGYSHASRGWALVRYGQPSKAAADLGGALEQWAKVPHLDMIMQEQRARVLALRAGLGGEANSGVTKAEAAAFADQSVAALRDVFSAGWGWPDELKEPDFDALRGRADFQKLVAELEAKAGPKAKPKD